MPSFLVSASIKCAGKTLAYVASLLPKSFDVFEVLLTLLLPLPGFRYPNATYANTTNGAGFHTGELGEHAVRCRERFERRPNFFLVDFFNEGNVFDVEYGMNAN
jgi:hypothetical protein